MRLQVGIVPMDWRIEVDADVAEADREWRPWVPQAYTLFLGMVEARRLSKVYGWRRFRLRNIETNQMVIL